MKKVLSYSIKASKGSFWQGVTEAKILQRNKFNFIILFSCEKIQSWQDNVSVQKAELPFRGSDFSDSLSLRHGQAILAFSLLLGGGIGPSVANSI